MRLVREGDFRLAFREGSRARGSNLLVVVRVNGLAHSRLGLSVGKSVWKSAVKRNRVRRIFREAFRLSYPDLPQGLDIVMIAARPGLVPALADCRAELVALSRKALAKTAGRRRSSEAEASERRSSGSGTGERVGGERR